MVKAIATALCLALILTQVARAQPGLFDQGQSDTTVDQALLDNTGITARGSLGYRPGVVRGRTELLKGQAHVGNTCGAFKYGLSFSELLDRMPGLLEELLDSVIGNLPLLLACYTSPTVCDLVKYWQGLINSILSARFAQCNQVQTAMAAAGLRLRGGQAAQCLEDAAGEGLPIDLALSSCLGQLSSLRTPNGTQAGSYELIGETLDAAGVDPGTKDLLTSLLGTMTFTANGTGMGISGDMPKNPVHKRYAEVLEEMEQAVASATGSMSAGGALSPDVLKTISIPGQPIPLIALRGLAMMRADPVRYPTLLRRLSMALAMMKVKYDIGEAQRTLAALPQTNPHHKAQEQKALEERVKNLHKELKDLEEQQALAQATLFPVLQTILEETARMDIESGAIRGTPVMPRSTGLVTGQTPIGYSYK